MNGRYLALGCYGKLPFHPEYLSEVASHSTAGALKQWIHGSRRGHGLSDSGNFRLSVEGVPGVEPGAPLSGGAPEPRETRSHRFIYGVTGSVDVLVGLLRPSSDFGGAREFPFVVFAPLPRRLYSRNYALLPLALAPVWDALATAWQNLAEVTSLAAFKEVVVSTRIPAPRGASEVRADFESHHAEGSGRVFDGHEGSTLDTLLQNFPRLLKDLRTRKSGVRVELPVSSDPDTAAFDSSFWVDLINRQFFFKRFEPQVFLEEAPGPRGRHVYLAFGDLDPADYAQLMGLREQGDAVARPAFGGTVSSGSPSGRDLTYAEIASRRL